MIRRTFQLISGMGPWREKDLWARGISTWDDFPVHSNEPVVSARHDGPLRDRMERAREALANRDLRTLAGLIPEREHWRLYAEFSSEAAFFDIEAERLGSQKPTPTVVSVFDRRGLHTFIAGRNLGELRDALAQSAIWVTFNGACYDLPVLTEYFSAMPTPAAHLDLRFLCRPLRLRGGLKQIEDHLGVSRPPHLRGVNGWDAALLWSAFRHRGDLEALRFLVEYNLYDSVNLRTLMDHAYNRRAEDLNCSIEPRPVFDRGEVLYDISKLVLALGGTNQSQRVLERVRRFAANRRAEA